MRRVLVVADWDWWVFAKIYRGLKAHCQNWQLDVHYARVNPVINHKPYNIVLFLCDHLTKLIDSNHIPKEKLILALRSESLNPSSGVHHKAKVLAAANEKLLRRFEKVHPKVMLAPGGVDTDKFAFKERCPLRPLVGWAGSRDNFGKDFRGLGLIEEACKRVNIEFRPALREERLRSEDEMVKYYHDNIDIYVDMSLSAGRQNGILEAGACGLPVITSYTGLARTSLAETLWVVDRKVPVLAEHLRGLMNEPDGALEVAKRTREKIEKEWSWQAQAPLFEKLFEEIVNE